MSLNAVPQRAGTSLPATTALRREALICSFSGELRRFNAPEGVDLERWDLVLSNYDYNFIIENGYTARPWELRVYSLNGTKP